MSDRASLRKRFSLLPLRSGKAVFIKLDKKRVNAMCSEALPIKSERLGLKWYDQIIDPSRSIKNQTKHEHVMDNFTTDGVQLKIGLSRSKSPEDLLNDRGYKSLADKYSNDIRREKRGVFVLENTASDGDDTSGRKVVGLDPGVRDVYTSVIDSEDGPKRSTHSVSNSQWAQTQRTKLIRRKDFRWRRETGVSGLIDQMSEFHLKTSDYLDLVKGISSL